MTTLEIKISDELAARLVIAAAARGENVAQYAVDILEQAAQEVASQTESTPDAPRSLGEELQGMIGLVDSRSAEPPPLRFGDVYEAMFAMIMDEKVARIMGREKSK